MPPKAEVAIFEDDKHWQDIYQDLLADEGHNVVISAATRPDALEAVKRFGELGVRVAVVDANLNPYDADGADG